MRLYEILNETIDVIDNQKGAGLTSNNQDVDYFGRRVMMLPSMFLKLASKETLYSSSEGLKDYIFKGGKVASPFLQIELPQEWLSGDYSKLPQIYGHEGRNRCKAILDKYIEVHLFFRYLRNRHITDDILANINKVIISEDGVQIKGPIFK